MSGWTIERERGGWDEVVCVVEGDALLHVMLACNEITGQGAAVLC